MAWVVKADSRHGENCQTCLKHKANRPEPLCPTPFSERPWQEVGIDFFQCQSVDYLIAVYYYSRFIEIAAMNRSKKGNEVVRCLKSMFSRHGIPERVRSDNGPPSTLVSMPNLLKIGDFLFRRAAPSSQDPTGKLNVQFRQQSQS